MCLSFSRKELTKHSFLILVECTCMFFYIRMQQPNSQSSELLAYYLLKLKHTPNEVLFESYIPLGLAIWAVWRWMYERTHKGRHQLICMNSFECCGCGRCSSR